MYTHKHSWIFYMQVYIKHVLHQAQNTPMWFGKHTREHSLHSDWTISYTSYSTYAGKFAISATTNLPPPSHYMYIHHTHGNTHTNRKKRKV